MLILPTPPTDVLNLFGFPIYIYGIIMACAIFVAIIVANSFFNKHNPIRYKDVILENAVYIIFSGILGARLYYCLLNYSYYFAKPLEILDIRQGGLSIHGAVLGGVLCLIFISHKAKTSLLKLLDAISTATILGQAIGRWGNYFNSEAYGLPVKSQTWGVLIPESRRLPEYLEYSLYHPTFLYESCLIIAGIRTFGNKENNKQNSVRWLGVYLLQIQQVQRCNFFLLFDYLFGDKIFY